MEEKILERIRKKRNDLAYKIETLLQDFTNDTNYIVDKIRINYEKPNLGIVPKNPAVRISIRLGIDVPPEE